MRLVHRCRSKKQRAHSARSTIKYCATHVCMPQWSESSVATMNQRSSSWSYHAPPPHEEVLPITGSPILRYPLERLPGRRLKVAQRGPFHAASHWHEPFRQSPFRLQCESLLHVDPGEGEGGGEGEGAGVGVAGVGSAALHFPPVTSVAMQPLMISACAAPPNILLLEV